MRTNQSAAVSLLVFRQIPTPPFLMALIIMAAGAWLASSQGKPGYSRA